MLNTEIKKPKFPTGVRRVLKSNRLSKLGCLGGELVQKRIGYPPTPKATKHHPPPLSREYACRRGVVSRRLLAVAVGNERHSQRLGNLVKIPKNCPDTFYVPLPLCLEHLLKFRPAASTSFSNWKIFNPLFRGHVQCPGFAPLAAVLGVIFLVEFVLPLVNMVFRPL
jgi:hypothetical protein